jgi:hypothetical protein
LYFASLINALTLEVMLHCRTISMVCDLQLPQRHCDMCPQHMVVYSHVWATRWTPARKLTVVNVQNFMVFLTYMWLCGLATFGHSWWFGNVASVRVRKRMVLFTTAVSCCIRLTFIAITLHPRNTFSPLCHLGNYWYLMSVAPWQLIQGKKSFQHIRLETHNLQQLFPLQFSMFCQITKVSYGQELLGHSTHVYINYIKKQLLKSHPSTNYWSPKSNREVLLMLMFEFWCCD